MPSLKKVIFLNKQRCWIWDQRVSLCWKQVRSAGGVGVLQSSTMPSFFACEHYFSYSCKYLCQDNFNFKVQTILSFQAWFSDLWCLHKRWQYCWIRSVGRKVVGGGVKDNCEYSGLIFLQTSNVTSVNASFIISVPQVGICFSNSYLTSGNDTSWMHANSSNQRVILKIGFKQQDA